MDAFCDDGDEFWASIITGNFLNSYVGLCV